MNEINKGKLTMKAAFYTLIVNAVLTAVKLAAGILGRSSAMISDAVHSASDVFSTLIVMVGVRMAGKESDEDHQYGHERFECVAAILLAAALCYIGVKIGIGGISRIVSGTYGTAEIPGIMALAAAIISIVIKEGMYWYTRAIARKTGSGALMADAWHHRSDALSSIGSFLGIFGARMGFPVADSIASIIICLFIIKVSVDIFRDAIDKMTDKACGEEVVEKIRDIVEQEQGVLGIDEIKTRLFADKIYVDIEIRADGASTLNETHATAQRVHDRLEESIPKIKHCMVHVNPVCTSD